MSHVSRCFRCGKPFRADTVNDRLCAKCKALGNAPQPFPADIPDLETA